MCGRLGISLSPNHAQGEWLILPVPDFQPNPTGFRDWTSRNHRHGSSGHSDRSDTPRRVWFADEMDLRRGVSIRRCPHFAKSRLTQPPFSVHFRGFQPVSVAHAFQLAGHSYRRNFIFSWFSPGSVPSPSLDGLSEEGNPHLRRVETPEGLFTTFENQADRTGFVSCETANSSSACGTLMRSSVRLESS